MTMHVNLERKRPGQALVEFAIMLPLIVMVTAVAFQFILLFITYMSVLNATRDASRYVAVHPNHLDGTNGATPCVSQPCSTTYENLNAQLPSNLQYTKVTWSISPACTSLPCSRGTGTDLRTTLTYDASSIVFLPTTFGITPWLRVKIPTNLPAYSMTVMVDPDPNG
jgi:Flp pilus assembly protein TadG